MSFSASVGPINVVVVAVVVVAVVVVDVVVVLGSRALATGRILSAENNHLCNSDKK